MATDINQGVYDRFKSDLDNEFKGWTRSFKEVNPLIEDASSGVTDFLKRNTLSENNLLPGQRALDEGTKGLITAGLNRANEDSGVRVGRMTEGLDSGFNSLPSAQNVKAEEDALGVSTPSDFGEALNNISKNKFKDTYSSLKRDAAYNDILRRSDEKASVSNALARNEQLKLKNYSEQLNFVNQRKILNEQIRQAKEAGRSDILGSILGGLGAIAGFAVAGPVGAAIFGKGAKEAGDAVA